MAEYSYGTKLTIPDEDIIKGLFPDTVTVRIISSSTLKPKFKIRFEDGSYLDCSEEGQFQGLRLNKFWYNWYNADDSLIMKFHNHDHDDDPNAREDTKRFDPLHVQFPENVTDTNGNLRYHGHFESLEEVLAVIWTLTKAMPHKK
ncbi:DUF6516 family protein [Paenibacillus aurantiacus]|uniref:DUF6516 family protein n=1 Tax=Paenibacillus aurantiacus TaxID=1936118 RepID=A0ABV5KZR2_9BACL